MTRITLRWLASAAALALAGCGGKGDATSTAASEPVVAVGRENLAVATMTELRSGPAISGSLEPQQAATVRAEVGGSVLETYAEAGQPVHKGTLLARLEDAAVRDAYLSAKSGVRAAESSLDLAKRNAERTERLAQAGAVAQRDLETARVTASTAEGALADAQARLASAQQQLAHTTVRAPFTGIVSERQADAGDVLQVGGALFSIVDPTSLKLEASVPAEQIGRLRKGTAVEFTVHGFARRFIGKIERINPVVDPNTRQVKIYVSIPNGDRSLVAGLFAQGRVATDTKRAVAVPVSAIDNRGTSTTVHRVKDGRVAEVPVQLGVRDEAAEMVEVSAGVTEGDTLLLGSAQGVAPGSRVRVLQEEAER
ncbi:MAG TPA: efflux RND transporter periplasmic adaptor subunit [Gemmatimonadales bacterium]|jgi:RND family efflux transporter MFP subunit|nr:efflux RND transporter periplasmic adaptor subunit [Gemmatimonadales bacterium]